MEHIEVTRLDNGMLLLRPAEGYALHNIITDRYYSEAIVARTKYWEAVRLEDVPVPIPTDEDEISDAEALNIILGGKL